MEGNERGVNMTVCVWIEKAVTDESPTIIRAENKSVTQVTPALKKIPLSQANADVDANDELIYSTHEFTHLS